MKKLIRKLYILLIPKWIRNQRNLYKAENQLKVLKKKIIHYYLQLPKSKITPEQKQIVQYLKENPITCYPYYFHKKYTPSDIEVFKDIHNSLLFTLLDGKKLFFKRAWNIEKIKNYFNDLLIEQDINSPHRYLTDDFQVNNNDIVVDVGVAEGNFSLSIVEKVNKLYLFETDDEWIEALNATFLPWKEKVTIINSRVSNINSKTDISLDSFFLSYNRIDFLKIDVDGAESELLQGCKNLFLDSKLSKIALCTYHKQNDEKLFTELLICNGFNISYSNGYMIFYHDKNIDAPYLRRGLIRATKTPQGKIT